MTRTLKQLDDFANALKARLDKTDANVAALTARVAAIEATPVPIPEPEPVPPPVPASTSGVYGSAIGGDTRNNHRLDGTVVSYRFRSAGGTPKSVKVSERTGSGYSMGTGGKIRASIQADALGKPSGTMLAYVEWSPGNPGTDERWPEHLFVGATLIAKGLYHIVFQNTDPSPSLNYISLNALYTFNSAADHPGQPDLALLENGVEKSHDLPIFDLAYTDGSHDGQAYIGCMIANFGVIGGSNQVRQTLTVPAITVSSVAVRVRRSLGSSPLILRLEHSDGAVVEEVSIAASSIAPSAAGKDDGGAVWAKGTFTTPRILTAGAYNLVLKTASGTEYTAAPLQDGITKGLLSPAYRGGGAEKSSGGSWTPLYPYTDTAMVDLQFYFEVTA